MIAHTLMPPNDFYSGFVNSPPKWKIIREEMPTMPQPDHPSVQSLSLLIHCLTNLSPVFPIHLAARSRPGRFFPIFGHQTPNSPWSKTGTRRRRQKKCSADGSRMLISNRLSSFVQRNLREEKAIGPVGGSIEWRVCEVEHLDAQASLTPMSTLGVVSVYRGPC